MKHFFLSLFSVAALNFYATKTISPSFDLVKKQAEADNKHNVTFSENLGQVTDQYKKQRPDVLFSGTDGRLVFHLKNNGIIYQQSKVTAWSEIADPVLNKKFKTPSQTLIYRVDVKWLNCNASPTIQKLNALSDHTNYYSETHPDGIIGVRAYGQLIYKNIYNGIDLKWYQNEGRLKYDYYVAAGADHTQIKLEFAGAQKLHINKNGELVITTPLGNIIEQIPYVTQNGKTLNAKWQINNTTVSFKIFNVDVSLPMIIDPGVRVWGTYYGGSGSGEVTAACATDANSNVYIAGYTDTNNGTGIATVGSHQSIYSGGVNDAYLAKFDSLGVRQWGTYYGGTIRDAASCCATDNSGNVFMGGYSLGGAAMATAGAHQTASGGNWDAFLVKFNSAGIRQWSTFYGGPGPEFGQSCATDGPGNIYLAGKTDSNNGNVIATAGSHQSAFGGTTDAFLVKFNTSGVRQWATYYGGTGADNAFGCAANKNNEVYLTGVTDCTVSNVISTSGSHQAAFGGFAEDAFLVKFNSSGVRQWATYYGGTGNETGYSCAADAGLNVYLTGKTESTNGTSIATAASHQATHGGGLTDAFIVKFDNAGTRQWGSYYGGTGAETSYCTAVHASGDVYIAGHTSSTTGNTVVATSNGHQNGFGGGLTDGFMAQFNGAGVRQWGSFYGQSGDDYIYGLSADAFYNFYIVGATNTSSGFGIATFFGHQSIFGGGAADGYLARFYDCAIPSDPVNTTSTVNVNICVGQSATLTASGSGTLAWYPTLTSTNSIGTGTSYITPTLSVGNYSYYVEAETCAKSASRTIVSVTVNSAPTITVSSISSASVICAGQSATLQASGAATYTWSEGSNGNLVVVNPTVTTTYTATGTSAAGCSASNTVAVSVYNAAPATLTATDYTACLVIFGGSPISLTGSPSGGTYSGTNVSGGTFNPTAIGTFTPMYTYTDGASNCTSTASITITVASCLGISENKNNSSVKLSIVPNPNSGICTISSDTDLELTIIDQLGRIVTSVSLNEKNNRTHTLSNLASGVYFVMDKNSDQKINRKIVVIK
ncbi:MAG: SBBP repeat-containing protein [Bacteroidia bacterium]|nr:SBBP repeat-containing protein [Bacteroidia bacterium]